MNKLPTRHWNPKNKIMRPLSHHTSLLLALVLFLLTSCDKTPMGVLSTNEMADLIVDLQLADAYIDSHSEEFDSDSSMLVIKQSVFKKHGITQEEYDSSLVWYSHNMDDYIKAHDKAIGKLKERYDKLSKDIEKERSNLHEGFAESKTIPQGGHQHNKYAHIMGNDTKGDTVDLWQGNRSYMLLQGERRGFITFDVHSNNNKKPGDRYQLVYKLCRGGNDFKVSLNVDYTDGTTAQMSRSTKSDGWITIDLQSDTTRMVRRVYGYLSYDIKRGHSAYVDSLMLMRTRLNKNNYGFINAQRLLERNKK